MEMECLWGHKRLAVREVFAGRAPGRRLWSPFPAGETLHIRLCLHLFGINRRGQHGQEVWMAIAPRFHRVAALQRPFVDRERVLAAFTAELERIGTGPRVFSVTVVGGIGKSRLLPEVTDRAAPRLRTR